MKPITLPLKGAVRVTGLSRSTLHRLLQEGEIVAVDAHGRTVFTTDSLESYIARCPRVVPTGRL